VGADGAIQGGGAEAILLEGLKHGAVGSHLTRSDRCE
jgi:hypothetical protein